MIPSDKEQVLDMNHMKYARSLLLLLTAVVLSLSLPFGVSAADPLIAEENLADIPSGLAPYTNDPMPLIVTMIVISAVGIVVLLIITGILKRKGK